MAESIYLQLPRPGEPVRWLLLDSLGNSIGYVQQGALADAAAHATGRHLTVLVPAEDVTLTHVQIPSRNPQKVLQAVPYMLEDKLAEDVETLHFALGLRSDAGQLVAVIGRERLQAHLAELAAAGLEPLHFVPDVCALPPEPNIAVVALENNATLVRLPDGGGFAADPVLALELLKRRLAEGTAGLTRLVIHGMPEAVDAFDATFGDSPLERVKQPQPNGLLPSLASSLTRHRGLDLLQGEFKRQTPLQEHWRQWRLAAVLAAACILLGLVQQAVSYVHLRREAARLDAQVVQLFNQAMPGSRLVPGSEQQEMKARLAALQGGNSAGSLLALLDTLGTALGANPSVQVLGINYQGGNLQAQLQAGDIGTLDALKTALNKQSGISANLDSVNASGSQVTGRIVLSGGAT